MTEVPSPCINFCDLDEAGEYCLGCGRSLDEIALWGGASDTEKRAIIAQLPERLLSFDNQANPLSEPP